MTVALMNSVQVFVQCSCLCTCSMGKGSFGAEIVSSECLRWFLLGVTFHVLSFIEVFNF